MVCCIGNGPYEYRRWNEPRLVVNLHPDNVARWLNARSDPEFSGGSKIFEEGDGRIPSSVADQKFMKRGTGRRKTMYQLRRHLLKMHVMNSTCFTREKAAY